MGKRKIPIQVEAGRLLFRGWIPGQIPGGKNQTVLKEGKDGKLRTMPRRRGKRKTGDPAADYLAGGGDGLTPFERWRAAPVELFRIRAKARPRGCLAFVHEGPIRLVVDYYWGDWNGRDEDGRMGALGHVLQNGNVICNDGQLRQFWSYHFQDTDRPGIAFKGWSEAIECSPVWIPHQTIEPDYRTRAGFSYQAQKVPGVIFL